MNWLWACLRLGAAHRFTHRFEVFTSFLSAALVIGLNGGLWAAAADGRAGLGGLSAGQLSTYVTVAWVLAAVGTSRIDELLGTRFANGDVIVDLLRPLDLQAFLVLRELGRGAAGVALLGIPLLGLGAWVFPFEWPVHPGTWLVFLFSTGLAVILGAEIAFLFGIAGFRLGRSTGLSSFRTTLSLLASGTVIPLDVLPKPVAAVLGWLPFYAVAHLPATLFLERLHGFEVVQALCVQIGWVAVLYGFGAWAWRAVSRDLSVRGG